MTENIEEVAPGSSAVPTFHLGHRMNLALEYADIGKAEMAEYLGVSDATLLRWTKLVTPVKRHILVAWALRTGVSLEWLETGGAPRDTRGYLRAIRAA